MGPFIHDDFLLENRTARRLYDRYAEAQPIIDYHCHISAKDIAENRRFRDLFEIWLEAPVMPAGWHEWHAGETHSLDTAFYAEYHSSGSGANPSARDPHSHQLTEAEAQNFSTENSYAVTTAGIWKSSGMAIRSESSVPVRANIRVPFVQIFASGLSAASLRLQGGSPRL